MTLPDPQSDSSEATPDWEPIVRAIGPKVHEVRQEQGLSLQQLAARANVSAAAIHKVERGDMVPTITTLLKIVGALGRPISHFVDDADRPAPVAVHVRAAGRPPAPRDWAPEARGVTSVSLSLPEERLRSDAVQAVIEPGGSSGGLVAAREGKQLLLVLGGTLTVEVAGKQHVVQPGDTLTHPTDCPYSWHNAGDEPAVTLWWQLNG
ncbi:helix-turn-helix domain-containing protein [Pseudonocardia spinosispora]|uniref:helix-turn-helix domain-containing protein n=1 Tax=Pseudonocardia spinosispora TaxID=103441 RepID=UPI000418F01A|nr:helix-turn-helix domain-containing protein [Pseudonocardia spinosispora]